ncbi:MAG: DUF2110 family protein [Candidatus Heimdallarchaeota archaeon]|nr:DUF2110 family protein [Candidatus Heimdallarchaeota archaeon]
MIKIKLLTKIRGKKQEIFQLFRNDISEAIKDLDVAMKSISFDEFGFVTLELDGEDEVVAANYLTKLFGQSIPLDKIKNGEILKGYICSSGQVGFGLFIDIGIKQPYAVDALIPLYTLREQLANGLKIPVRKIIDDFALIDTLPLEIIIEKVNIGMKKIEAKLTPDQIAIFEKWRDEGLEKLIVVGAFEGEIATALEKTSHDKDVISLEKLGWMEFVLTCKFNTSAKGLIPHIGRVLPKARFEIFSPSNIKKTLKEFQRS